MKKAVLFDCDGVLLNSEYYYLTGTIEWMNQKGYHVTKEDILPIIGTSYQVTCEILAKLAHTDVDTAKAMNDEYFTQHPVPFGKIIKDNVISLLDTLSVKGIKCAICTSTPVTDLKRILKETGFEEYFHYTVSGDELTATKPNPQIYLHAADKLGLDPRECLVVEDSSIGIAAGKAAGMQVLALKDETIPMDQSKADIIIEDILEVLNYL